MKLNRVLIVFKDIKKAEPKCADGSGRELRGLMRQHVKTLDQVRRALENLSIPYALIDRKHLRKVWKGDLFITIGGDGTFLDAAHIASAIPIMGVNSMPGYSIGAYCIADEKSFDGTIRKIIGGELTPKKLPLIEMKIDGKRVPKSALNDILFAGGCPAEMSRYILQAGKIKERQRSSGIWIAAGPGSTAAILSAGGKPQGITSQKLQYVVREPNAGTSGRYKLLRGILKKGESIRITSEMNGMAAFIDGPKIVLPIRKGQIFSASISNRTLQVFL